MINESKGYLNKLKELDLDDKNRNKIDNQIGDAGSKAIFNNAKYTTNFKELDSKRMLKSRIKCNN